MYIKDTLTGTIRKYGSERHDSLMISNDGTRLYYYNLQCGEGSQFGTYVFCTDEKGLTPNKDEVLLKHGAEAYFNIGGFNDAEYALRGGEEDLQELEDRFGKNVREVVEDMISGKGNRYLRDFLREAKDEIKR